jgi:hypothetical protein
MIDGYPRGGHMGRFLRVDLGPRKISDEAIDKDFLHQYIGSTGLGIRPFDNWKKSFRNHRLQLLLFCGLMGKPASARP